MTSTDDFARSIGLAHEEPQFEWKFTLVPKFVRNLWPHKKRSPQNLISANEILKDFYVKPIVEQLNQESFLLQRDLRKDLNRVTFGDELATGKFVIPVVMKK